ncbi:MAG TPA: hypothetical protein VF705_01020 [Longimicrobium sp.]|jgi:hypothetical protein
MEATAFDPITGAGVDRARGMMRIGSVGGSAGEFREVYVCDSSRGYNGTQSAFADFNGNGRGQVRSSADQRMASGAISIPARFTGDPVLALTRIGPDVPLHTFVAVAQPTPPDRAAPERANALPENALERRDDAIPLAPEAIQHLVSPRR